MTCSKWGRTPVVDQGSFGGSTGALGMLDA